MNFRNLLICLILGAIFGSPRIFAQKPTSKHNFKIASHRGDWRNHPENSLRSIQSCIDAGVDIVEVDVRRTSDGELILFHDDSLERMTDGSGYVADITYDTIGKLRLKEGYGFLTKEKVPTLQDALLLSKGKIKLYLDKSLDFVEEIYPILKQYGMKREVFFGDSKDYKIVRKKIGTYLDSIQFIPFVTIDNTSKIGFAKEYIAEIDPQIFGLRIDDDPSKSYAIRDFLKRKGKRLWISAARSNGSAGHDDEMALVNPQLGWGWLLSFGADIIFTDRPLKLVDYRNKL